MQYPSLSASWLLPRMTFSFILIDSIRNCLHLVPQMCQSFSCLFVFVCLTSYAWNAFLLSIISSNISTLNIRHHLFEVFPDLHAVVLVSTCHLCRHLNYHSSYNAYLLVPYIKCDLVDGEECVLNLYLQQLWLLKCIHLLNKCELNSYYLSGIVIVIGINNEQNEVPILWVELSPKFQVVSFFCW